jgi:hypothetical protein
MSMTFELVRIGWPNTAAILALAITPMVAFTAAPDRYLKEATAQRTAIAAMCPAATEHALLLTASSESAVQ